MSLFCHWLNTQPLSGPPTWIKYFSCLFLFFCFIYISLYFLSKHRVGIFLTLFFYNNNVNGPNASYFFTTTSTVRFVHLSRNNLGSPISPTTTSHNFIGLNSYTQRPKFYDQHTNTSLDGPLTYIMLNGPILPPVLIWKWYFMFYFSCLLILIFIL